MYSQQKGQEERRRWCFAWLERASGGGARPQGLVEEDLQWQRANRAATARVSLHVRKELERAQSNMCMPNRSQSSDIAAQRGGGTDCTLSCVQLHRAWTVYRVQTCAQRFMGGQARRRQMDAQMGGPDACPFSRRRAQGCRQRPQRFRRLVDGALKRFWVAPGTFYSRHRCLPGKARR
jgi:hypothetical protein